MKKKTNKQTKRIELSHKMYLFRLCRRSFAMNLCLFVTFGFTVLLVGIESKAILSEENISLRTRDETLARTFERTVDKKMVRINAARMSFDKQLNMLRALSNNPIEQRSLLGPITLRSLKSVKTLASLLEEFYLITSVASSNTSSNNRSV